MKRTLAAASCVVVTGEGLLPAFVAWGTAHVVPATIPLGSEWTPAEPTHPPRLGWWSDGRQKYGMERVAPALIRVLEEMDNNTITGFDYFMIYGVVFFVILAVGAATLLLDLIYPLLDPRIRYSRK